MLRIACSMEAIAAVLRRGGDGFDIGTCGTHDLQPASYASSSASLSTAEAASGA